MELWIALGVVALFLVFMYNSLVAKSNQVKNAFAGIDVQLKKRYDLIPNLVSTVKQYASHEKDLLEKITELRTKAESSHSPKEKVELDNEISGLIGKIMVAVENYPDLKASENFLHLQQSLNEVEEQLSASRRSFNAAVLNLNNAVQMFPTNLMAGVMGLSTQTMFEIPESQRSTPNVANMFEQT